MDWIAGKSYVLEYIKKYRFALLLLLVGIFFMAMPEPKEKEIQTASESEETQHDLQEALEEILCKISGAGEVDVLLTQAEGEKILYQTDEDVSLDESKRQVVLVTNSERNETGLICQINPPKYLGAVILCQGADDARIRLSVVEAVMSVTGLTSDCITVLKMK